MNPPEKPSTSMTRKEALNVLYDLLSAHHLLLLRTNESGQFEHIDEMHARTWEALKTLMGAVYGPRHSPQLPFPCDVCRHQYAEHHAYEKGKKHTTYCCPACLQHLKSNGTLDEKRMEAFEQGILLDEKGVQV